MWLWKTGESGFSAGLPGGTFSCQQLRFQHVFKIRAFALQSACTLTECAAGLFLALLPVSWLWWWRGEPDLCLSVFFLGAMLMSEFWKQEIMFSPSLPLNFLVFQLTLCVCYCCMHLLSSVFDPFIFAPLKLSLDLFVCLWLRHQSAALPLMAGSVWHLWKYSNFSTGRHQSSGLLF